ncbi:conserved protein, unknown function [Plasmodium knowlesi strain H]|uniref:Fe-S cluster assembly protein n=3 Tax=Plasmodium knowlesi TaxID=5850 RepID=A0A5K1UYS6_PLAKH|nr:Fe-S cluster assembly protein, putative [Plasmodium knowlesi strain H]OTN64880.1 Uncharacterized protein PKNOH_S120145600 [Plasmodium knowlesi]CAA9988313.1 Fe-S cluster assembly protein, putative [Plasmodium knowlesi strain H]SBO20233.1 conserved protein, unknown function [Plasmodium knowlesi strain H]SBO20260.1 conserved protein, unknown function [Plasmodium knowlesi strain H]VVS77787.1 Fe-S cluster assembly protein, putative [Plasmodium knowlesi strain H]|eukprot:XP_002259292.1 hypothetical protein, conserved [Plasmodium knowlesi strain H]
MDSDFIDEEFVHGKEIEKIKKKKEAIVDCLKSVQDPDLKKNIVELNFVRNLKIKENDNGKYVVDFDLNLTTPACPVKDELLAECQDKLRSYEWIEETNINTTFLNFNEHDEEEKWKKKKNRKIENVIVVYSCKGGVGKSFFSVNLSFYLKKKGATVGLLDADINGPSLPTLLPIGHSYAKFKSAPRRSSKIFYEGETGKRESCVEELTEEGVNHSGGEDGEDEVDDPKRDKEDRGDVHQYDRLLEDPLIEPLLYRGVKLMSYAYIKNQKNLGFASFRGPILNELIKEFINQVDWGVLDYLIIDLPPGTHDIHLNLFESEDIDGVIMITTPNDLSINDVKKGISMCNYFNIPIVGLVVNMNSFICDGCEKNHQLFNNCDLNQLKEEFNNVYEIPFHPLLSKNVYHDDQTGERHFPFIISFEDDHHLVHLLEKVFQSLTREIAMIKFQHKLNLPSIQIFKKNYLQLSFDSIDNKFVFSDDVLVCHVKDVRRKCPCDICKMLGKKKKKKNKIQDGNLYVKEIVKLGIYNVKIVWSDMHISVYSYSHLKHIFLTSRLSGGNALCRTGGSASFEW